MFSECKPFFQSESLQLLKNNTESQTIVDLDNFSEPEYLDLLKKPLNEADELTLIVNNSQRVQQVGSLNKVLSLLRFHKQKLKVFTIYHELVPFWEAVAYENMESLMLNVQRRMSNVSAQSIN